VLRFLCFGWMMYIIVVWMDIQGVSRLVDITEGGDFLGLCDQKVHINMCPVLDGYEVMGIFLIPVHALV